MTEPSPSDEARFETLYRRTRSDVLAYLVRRSSSADEAADLLAETYLIAWQKLNAIPSGDSARLWLFGVARNVQLKGFRRRRVAHELVERLAGELRAARSASPIDEPVHDVLRVALAVLPERDREILTLTAWEGLTPREIAVVVDTSANAVRIRLHRARARLRKQLTSARGTPVAVKP